MKLANLGLDVRRQGGDLRSLVAGRDHDMAGGDRSRGRLQAIAVATSLQAQCPNAGADRQVMLTTVALEVVGQLVLVGEAVGWRRELRARKAVEARRREQPQRVPAVPPLVSDLAPSLQTDLTHAQ